MNIITNRTFKQSFFINLFICLIVCAISIVGGELDYPGNDDTFRNLISVGAFGDKYNYYLMYSNVIYGVPIFILNKFFPFINWYYWIMIIISLIAIAAVCTLLFKNAVLSVDILGCVSINLLLAHDYYIAVQFTKAASFWFMAGIVIFCLAIFNENKFCIAGLFFLLSGIMCRGNCALMLSPFVVLAFALILYRKRLDKNFGNVLKLGVKGLLITFIILGLAWGAEQIFRNTNEGWNDYWKYEGTNALVIDRGMTLDYEHNSVAYDKISTDDNDLKLYSAWQFGDIDFYNIDWLENVRVIESNYNNRSLRIDSNVLISPIFAIWDTFQSIHASGKALIAFMLCLMLYALCVGTGADKVYVVFNIIGIYGVYWYFACINRFMWRVECGIFVGVTLLMLLETYMILDSKHKSFVLYEIGQKKKLNIIFLTLAVMMIVIYSLTGIYNWRYEKDKHIVAHEADITGRLNSFRDDQDSFYILTDFFVTNNPMSITRAKYHGIYENSSYIGNWTFPSPSVQHYASLRGYRNPMRALVNDNVYLHATNPDLAEMIKNHLVKVLDKQLELIELDNELWQIKISE